MKQVLEERGVNVSKMKAKDMREKLQSMHDFKYEKTKVETLCLIMDIRAILFLNFIVILGECGHRVRNTPERTVTIHSFKGEETVEPALEGVSLESICKFFRKMRDYLRAYREGISLGTEMDTALKNISHIAEFTRAIFNYFLYFK